jgi:hypothetical protein
VTAAARQIIEQVLTLSEAEQREVREALLGSMLEADDAAWLDELDERVARARAGAEVPLDGQRHPADLRVNLRASRSGEASR